MKELTIGYRGPVLLDLPLLNKGSAFNARERQELGLHGLIPECIETIEEQVERCHRQFKNHATDMDKHVYLRNLQDTNETLFYRLLRNHLEELMPIVYTPTVGEACQEFSSIYRRARGLFISWPHRDDIDTMVNTVTKRNVRVIVITDGERILGLGDQGIGGMGIPIGKLSLYTGCGGISPAYTLPVVVDVGTNNPALLEDPMYMGWRHRRIENEDDYLAMMDMVIDGLLKRWPQALIQFEDFALTKANMLLDRYKDRLCCFNDDIQGTAAVTLGALISAAKQSGKPLKDQRILFFGAGSAGCGIAAQLIDYLTEESGLSREEAVARVFVCNRAGVLHSDDGNLLDFQRRVSQPPGSHPHLDHTKPGLQKLVQELKPSVLIGVTGRGGVFTREAITTMAEGCERPIILPLSNPTSSSEAQARELIEWTDGRAIVATGSPFAPVEFKGKVHRIAQCNNCYIFPGVGLGVLASGARRVTGGMMMAAARALADYPSEAILPPIGEIMQVSMAVAVGVARRAWEEELCDQAPPSDLDEHIRDSFWAANYREYKAAPDAVG